jgi:hypothetical protein
MYSCKIKHKDLKYKDFIFPLQTYACNEISMSAYFNDNFQKASY